MAGPRKAIIAKIDIKHGVELVEKNDEGNEVLVNHVYKFAYGEEIPKKYIEKGIFPKELLEYWAGQGWIDVAYVDETPLPSIDEEIKSQTKEEVLV